MCDSTGIDFLMAALCGYLRHQCVWSLDQSFPFSEAVCSKDMDLRLSLKENILLLLLQSSELSTSLRHNILNQLYWMTTVIDQLSAGLNISCDTGGRWVLTYTVGTFY